MPDQKRADDPPWSDNQVVRDREIVFAIALGILNDEGQFLAVKRSKSADEFKDMWSIPTFSVSELEFKRLREGGGASGTLAQSIVDRKGYPAAAFNGSKDWQVARIGVRDRASYLLVMALVMLNCTVENIDNLRGPDGQIFEYISADEFIRRTTPGIGTCGSLLMCELMDRCHVPPTVRYLEIPPELSGLTEQDILSRGNEFLWSICFANYGFYRAGWSGSTGHAQLLLLDKYLEERLTALQSANSVALRILDFGSGQRSPIVEAGRRLGCHVDTLDPNNGRALDNVRSTGETFDVIFATNVVQWIDDISVCFDEILSLLNPQHGRFVASLPTPEFYRSGSWLGDPNDGIWTISKPITGGAELDMIGHAVGPLIRYRRSTADYVNALLASGFALCSLTSLPPGDGSVISPDPRWPGRHRFVPAFSIFEVEAARR